MSFLTDANWIGNGINKLSSDVVQKRKFLFIEGLIRFLELYGQNEFGNAEVDIEKVSLYVNNATFENNQINNYTSIEKIYKSLENDLYNNIPLFRFLKLSDHQKLLLETEHHNQLLKDYAEDAKKYPCLRCIFYRNESSWLGMSSKCNYPESIIANKLSFERPGFLDISTKKNCKNVVTLDEAILFKYRIINTIQISHYKNEVIDIIDNGVEFLREKLKNIDNCSIPPYIPDEDHVELKDNRDRTDKIISDLGRAFKNQLTFDEIRQNHINAIFLEAMIKFVELYAQTELGSNYVADISKIAEYVNNNKFDFDSKDKVYKYLEDQIYDGFNITKFCKVNDFI